MRHYSIKASCIAPSIDDYGGQAGTEDHNMEWQVQSLISRLAYNIANSSSERYQVGSSIRI